MFTRTAYRKLKKNRKKREREGKKKDDSQSGPALRAAAFSSASGSACGPLGPLGSGTGSTTGAHTRPDNNVPADLLYSPRWLVVSLDSASEFSVHFGWLIVCQFLAVERL
jgi:hypothetical protein